MKSYGLLRVLFVRLLSACLIVTVTACVAVAKPHSSRKAKSQSVASPLGAATAQKNAGSGAPASESSTADPIRHTIARGQTLYRISSMYGVSVKEICRANGIKDPARVKAGMVLQIPRRSAPGRRPAPARGSDPLIARSAPATSPVAGSRGGGGGGNQEGATGHEARQARAVSASRSAAPLCSEKTEAAVSGRPGTSDHNAALCEESPATSDEGDWADDEGASDIGPAGVTYTLIPSDDPFSWPVQGGLVFSPFGKRRGRLHAGIDIAAPYGTIVYSARDGIVTFSGRKHGYGNVIIVDHGDGFATLYAHNSKNVARQGDHVVRGQIIARVGATGNATGAHCHFEIRKTNVALDPSRYISTTVDTAMTAASRDTRTEKPAQINKAGIGAGLLPIP